MKRFFPLLAFLTLAIPVYCQDSRPETSLMTVKSGKESVSVLFSNGKGSIQISFFPCGVNQITGIGKISYFKTAAGEESDQADYEFTSCTDWIGPYMVCSRTSLGTGISPKFTGGWHGSNGDGTGDATAKTIETRLVVDGTGMDGTADCRCSQVDLYITNLIQGFDYPLTNSYLLKETVHYSMKPNRKIEIEVRTEALEDAVIKRYYGLQSQNADIFDEVSYWSDKKLSNSAAVKSDSQCENNDHINTILLTGSRHRLKLVIDTNEGLGRFENLGGNKPKAFSARYGKSYFNLINNKDLFLPKGEAIFWRGCYLWG